MQIRGGERLGWNQTAPSLQDLRAHTYVLYIDGSRNSLSDVQCADGASGSYACSGRLPTMSAGQHVLELAAMWNGQESPRSSSLTVQLTALTTATEPQAAPPLLAGHDLLTCVGATGECYAVQVVMRSASVLTAPVSMPDGRVLVVEDNRLVRLVEDGVLRPEAALELDDAAERIVGLTIDSRFEGTRAIFVASTVDGRGGVRELRVTRLRELNGYLAQGATIVSGIVVPERARVPMAVDENGLLYVAVPAATDASGRAADYAGMVLRFTFEGLVPTSNRNGSPILAIGFERPTTIEVDSSRDLVWIGGTRDAWPHSVLTMRAQLAPDAEWPVRPAALLPETSEFVEPFFDFVASGTRGGMMRIVASGEIHDVTLGADGRHRAITAGSLSGIPVTSELIDTSAGERFVVAGSLENPRSILLRLTPR